MEKNCIFIEPENEIEAIWIVTSYKKNQFLDMYRVLPGVCVSQFTISLFENNEVTDAEISYEHTALGESGEKIVSEFTNDNFNEFMSHFEEAINHYLVFGEKIPD